LLIALQVWAFVRRNKGKNKPEVPQTA